MNLVEFLQNLVIKGWKFWNEGERLYYDAPSEQSTSSVLALLKQYKAAILQLLQERPDIFYVYPLSYGQRALWFLWQLAPESHAYNVSFAARICSVVDMTAMSKAFTALRERHSILRTTFLELEGELIQQVHQNQELDLLQIDASSWSEEQLKAKVISAHQIPFNLETGPVMRVRWFSCSDFKHVLLVSMHHIASDAWSLDMLIHELSALYQAQQATVEVSLTPLEHSYRDYVIWQRKILCGDQGEKLWNYWAHQLAGDLPALNLPTDRQRKPVQTYNGATHKFKLSSHLTEQLKGLAQTKRVTFYMILLAAFKVLLYRYTGQEDILVGSPTSGRTQPQFAPIFGYFVNPVVIRSNLSSNPSFNEFLTQVRQTVIEALTHQDYSFALIVEKLQPHRDPSRSPIFQASFTLQQLQQSLDILLLLENETQKDIDWGGMKLKLFDIPQQEGQFDLDLEMVEGSSSVVGNFKYNTDLFDHQTIERMVGHFQNLLSAIVENPQARVGEIPMLTELERHQLLVEWNETACEYPTDKCIHQLFEEQVQRTPSSVAVVFENQQLTYQELNHRANQLAHYLLSLGVGKEVLVGICVERSIEMVVGILGILKAGGAYVPLDPAYPQQRLSYMLTDSGVQVLLTHSELSSSLLSHSAQVVCLDTHSVVICEQSSANPVSDIENTNLAYVIYTSGSTGNPKGVLIPHYNVVRLLAATKSWFNFNENDIWTLFHSYAFDFSVWEIWGALVYGGQLIVVPYLTSRSPESFYNLLHTQKVTVLNQTPSAFAQLIQVDKSLPEVTHLNLRLVIFGGEALELQSLKPWFERHGDHSPQLVNMYGITETTVHVTYRPLSIADLSRKGSLIGYPIRDLQVYILDKNLQPTPIGVAGEMHIGGAGLARGYLNRPELTSEKFIPNPFCDSFSGRLYKTGDLACHRADGSIEYLGRIDNQVKIRGFRIELGEIEAVLNTHPQIQQAVVTVTELVSGNKRACAYVVPADESLTTILLREFLGQRLPEYMVPSAFVTLETLPLTPNGKIDLKALPEPDGEITRTEEYVAPRTTIEQTLTKIWQELLLKEKVSIHDNFFEIGGDSILSIQVVSRAKNSGIQITLKQIFQNQTIAELAIVVNTTQGAQCRQDMVTGIAPLTPIQHWFFAQNKLEAHHYNQSVLLVLPKKVQSEFIEIALEKLLSHHDALRLRFTSIAVEKKQINQGLEDKVPFTVVDLLSTPKLEQPQVLEEIATEYQASLNLSSGPIMQVVMFNLGDEDARLLMIIHHLAVDGVSWRILLSDLERIYQQLIAQKAVELGAKTTAFIDWSEKLNNYGQSEIVKLELDYWLNQPWSLTTRLPLDDADNEQENTVENAAYVSVKLSPEETQTLLSSVNEAYNTQINDILLSALAQALAEWTGNSTVLIDLEGHGREELFSDVDLSRTVGWFTSLFPVLLQLPAINQLGEIIKSIKEQLRAIPHRGIGYGILRYLCEDKNVSEQLQTIPTSEISFNYLGQFDSVQSETGWRFAPESTGTNYSPKQNREHLLDINALVVEGSLQIDWTYSSHVHTHATVEKLAHRYIQALRSIIEHCQLEEAHGYTPSDFPDAKLAQLELDELLAPLRTQKVESIYPLSPMQQGMLFHSLYAAESGMYFEQMTLSLKGNVNVAAFKSAWQKVVERYSIFRTLFVWENRSTPLQVVLKQVDLPWHNLDWRELSTTQQQQQLSKLLLSQREQGFPFHQAPLMECTFIQLSENTYKFIWNHHHILIDGWCLPIIFKDVFSFYEAERAGKTCYLPTPHPYRDYIAWLNSQNKEAASEFWRQTLHGFSAPTPLRVNKKLLQNQKPGSNYFEVALRLSAEVSRQLQSVAQQHRVTLSTIVQASWGLLLSRYSGETDVVFGVTVSGRHANLSGMENMVGLFINTLPLRLCISPQEQIIPWLQQIQQSMLELQHYSYTPLVDIQVKSEVPRGIPLFDSIVVFENYPVDSSLLDEGSSLQLSDIESFEQTNYPLTVVAAPGDELLIKISYDTVVFEENTIGRMLGHLQTIFSAIVENPQARVGEIPMLTELERHQLLVEWNETACEYPTDKCIHQLFEEQVQRTPSSVAVVFENQQLTYQELNHRANQLAHYLLSLGVGKEVLVGICVERSIEMVVGILGILKAGGAYVPLDPAYPQQRLSYMLTDSGVQVLLTHSELSSSLLSHSAQVVCLDTDWGVIEQYSQHNQDAGVASQNLVYVIYTSGSTGVPKGVMNTHMGVHNRLRWMQQSYPLTSSDRVVQKTPFSFDVSVWEFFWPLLTGARIVVALPEGHKDSTYLVNLIFQQQITTIHFVPSMLQVFLQEPNSGNCSSLKRVFCSGEALPFELTQRFFSKLECELHNLYGPTEASIDVTFWPCLPQENLQIVPIGRPISNTQIYILNKHYQPVPIGVLGELYIGGDGLARGYLNRPELTCEKFIANPFCDGKSERLYKTGDLARHLSDGNIEFLGRIDNQVKIRGFRIELGEIEAVLNTHPQIQQAVVIATGDIPGNKRLIAYVVPRDESLTTNQLREFLLRKLPEYMVPSAFVTLDTLPLTPNGKIDKKALPAPDGEITRETQYVAPRTPTEEIIANIFAAILSVQNVGIHDNFFTLGGHSLLATQLISRLRVAFSVEIPIRAVFESPTVTQLDQTITQLRTTDSGLTLPPIQPIEGDTELLPLSWAQERLWFLNQLEGSTATYNMPAAVCIT
ncbi:MAG: amino acid adenylation domain-containing protein, partial [Nostoc sp.]|uniref:amino acid adenylation domain-containing protein n=1 Tax=Nostoc sp. TaxID=1180 RepID=UPI002FF039A0